MSKWNFGFVVCHDSEIMTWDVSMAVASEYIESRSWHVLDDGNEVHKDDLDIVTIEEYEMLFGPE